MTKRILSLLLALVMVLGMLPAPVLATDSTEATASPTEIPTEAATQPQTEPAVLSETEPVSATELAAAAETEPASVTEPTAAEETEPASVTEPTAAAETEPVSTTEPTVAAETEPVSTTETTVETETAPTEATEPEKTEISGSTSNSAAQSNAEKSSCGCPMTDGLHDATCSDYICPDCGTGSWHQTCPEFGIGTRVKTVSFGFGQAYADIHNQSDAKVVGSGYFPAVMMVTGVETVNVITYYQLSAAEGYSWPESGISAGVKDGFWLESKYLERYEEENSCPVCGNADCTALHFWCSVCETYDCGKDHIYCPACGTRDCETVHVFCTRCGNYDCTEDHGEVYQPETAPVITAPSALVEGKEVTIADAEGTPVDSIAIPRGRKASLSAWCEWESALYQWQICYDVANDLWVDIQGQTGKGILVSEGMVMGILESQGSAALRCVMTSGEETRTSDPIAVYIQDEPVAVSFSTGNSVAMADASGGDELAKACLEVQYLYEGGRVASAPTTTAEIIPGTAVAPVGGYKLPYIRGYEATLTTNPYEAYVSLVTEGTEKILAVNIPEGVITAGTHSFVVTYVPVPVSYTVKHHLQNILDDYYTTDPTQDTGGMIKTGDIISNVDKTYEGFYHLTYETPAAAADGSTVINVYYDRKYYLMKFNLDGGYGVDPIYARYGTTVQIGRPTKAGYEFLGWDSNGDGTADITYGTNQTISRVIGATNVAYKAIWEPEETADVTVVIWHENPNNEGYSYQKTITVPNVSTDEKNFSWDSYCFTCGDKAHTHNALCGYDCGKEVHAHSASCYACGKEEHAHGRDCYTASGGTLSNSAENDTTWLNRLNNASPNGRGIYSVSSYNSTRYYVKIGNFYYRVQLGRWDDINDFSYSLNCGKTEHNHDATCGFSCGLQEHDHTAECYACGVTKEHVHSNQCGTDKAGMDSKLYTLVHSEEAEVLPNGTTVINVYYDRVVFTLKFNVSGKTVKTITDKWGADIHNMFPIRGDDGTDYKGAEWKVPNGCQNFVAGNNVLSIDIMPPENITFTRNSQNDDARLYYYVEVASEDECTREYNGRHYKLYKTVYLPNSGRLTEAEEFHDIAGFTKGDYYPNTIFSTRVSSEMWLYYTRNSYAIEFYNPTDLIQEKKEIPYERNLGSYDFVPSEEWIPDVYEPGSMEFDGWYENPDCSGEEYVLSEHTMPSATKNGDTALSLYAKWKPKEFDINVHFSEELEKLLSSHPDIKYGDTLGEVPDPERPGYRFVGWFYSENDVEKPFDPENTPIKGDWNIYAKWEASVMYPITVRFVRDDDKDGVPDVDDNGNYFEVAPSVTTSGVLERTYTFQARSGQELYLEYQDGYFPNLASHSIKVETPTAGDTTANTYNFLYQPRDFIEYTVQYLEKDTGKVLVAEKKVVSTNVAVTENFVYVKNYIPDASQKILVLSINGENVIKFEYTYNTENAYYIVNHYTEYMVQDSNGNWVSGGWVRADYEDGVKLRGESVTASSISITGYELNVEVTNKFNGEGVNGAVKDDDGNLKELPATVGALENNQLTGTVNEKGLELNFYYTPKYTSYEFRFRLKNPDSELIASVTGTAPYGSTVRQEANGILWVDMDGDGVKEDYRLENSAVRTKYILVDGVSDMETFYYVRCTQDITITKELVHANGVEGFAWNEPFSFQLKIHAPYFPQTEYESNNGSLAVVRVNGEYVLPFTLLPGQSITIQDLPTAVYTLTEVDVPETCEVSYNPGQTQTLTTAAPVNFNVTNTYYPATLSITKTVNPVEDDHNEPERDKFTFFVEVPSMSSGTLSYTLSPVEEGEESNLTATVVDSKTTIELKNGQTAFFSDMPLGECTVTEENYSTEGYNSRYFVNSEELSAGSNSAVLNLESRKDYTVACVNDFPVGTVTISKTVGKEFPGDDWEGDTFTFTLKRTNKPLPEGNQYPYAIDGDRQQTGEGDEAQDVLLPVDEDGKLTVTIPFSETGTRTLTILNLPVGEYEITETGNQYETYVYTTEVRQDNKKSETTIASTELKTDAFDQTVYFTNTLNRYFGTLKITKDIELDGVVSIPNDDRLEYFEIRVKLLGDENYIGTVNVEYSEDRGERSDKVSVTKGEFAVMVKENETVTITNVPAVTYQVTETDYTDKGYDEVITLTNGATTDNGTWKISRDTVSEVLVTNRYPVKQGKLTINKVVDGAPAGDDQLFVFHISSENGVDMDVMLRGAGNITISELPLGNYTVTEDTSWSWRYACTDGASKTVEIKAGNIEASVTFTNSYTNSKWITSVNTRHNDFTISTEKSTQ